MTPDLRTTFPTEIRNLAAFDGPFDAFRLPAERCEVLFATYPAGTAIDPHRHPTNNVGVVTKGRLLLEIDGVETSYGVGEWYHVPADTEHAARFDEDSAEIEFWFDRSPSSIKGVSFSEHQLLAAIQERPEGSATRVDLAGDVGLTASGATRAPKPLKSLEFVTTVDTARNARRSLATLTPAGVGPVSDAAGADDTLSKLGIVAELSPPARDHFLRALAEMARG
jgi:DNA-binding MarR family transcriptional regulator